MKRPPVRLLGALLSLSAGAVAVAVAEERDVGYSVRAVAPGMTLLEFRAGARGRPRAALSADGLTLTVRAAAPFRPAAGRAGPLPGGGVPEEARVRAIRPFRTPDGYGVAVTFGGPSSVVPLPAGPDVAAYLVVPPGPHVGRSSSVPAAGGDPGRLARTALLLRATLDLFGITLTRPGVPGDPPDDR